MVGDSNDETNFEHKLLLSDKQVSRLCKTFFANNSSANIKLSKKLPKIVKSVRFLSRLLYHY